MNLQHRARIAAGLTVGLTAFASLAGIATADVILPDEPLVELPCDPDAANPFVDLDPSSVHSDNVICAAQHDLVRGGPGGQPQNVFGPTGTTTRGQLATLVVNLMGDQPFLRDGVELFTDDDGHPHETSIDLLVRYDIVGGNGESGTSFFPDRAATRSEMASFMHRAYRAIRGTELPPGADVFVDDEDDPAEDEINALAAADVLSGKAFLIFDPGATLTREQIATFFVRLRDRLLTDQPRNV